jgi:O-antigen/teichoic acid export membrane protein
MKLPSLNVLLLTLAAGVFALLLPMVYGVLQGRQRFFWLGWAMLSLGVVRLGAAAGLVHFYGASALNGMVGVGLGFLCAFLIAGTTSGLPSLHPGEWLRCVTQINWRALLKKFVPLSLGGGAGIYMMSVDMVVVQRFFDKEQTGLYAAAGMIGRALIFFVGPMVMVMFPKIVRSRAEQKPTDVLRLTMMLTGGLCAMAGVLGSLVPELPLKLIYDESYLVVAPLVTWFIWAMIPLALAVVLVNNLLARSDYAVAYALPVVCAGYAVALVQAAPGLAEQTLEFDVKAYISVTKIIGAGNLAFLAVAGIFTWRHYRSEAEEH